MFVPKPGVAYSVYHGKYAVYHGPRGAIRLEFYRKMVAKCIADGIQELIDGRIKKITVKGSDGSSYTLTGKFIGSEIGTEAVTTGA